MAKITYLIIEEYYKEGLVSGEYQGSLKDVKEDLARGFYENFAIYDVYETADQFYKRWKSYSEQANESWVETIPVLAEAARNIRNAAVQEDGN